MNTIESIEYSDRDRVGIDIYRIPADDDAGDRRQSFAEVRISGVAGDSESADPYNILAAETLMPMQTHTCNVAVAESASEVFPETDALITSVPGLRIGVRTADCVPITLFARDIAAVAAIHAGWKGTLGGIVDNTLSRLVAMTADPSNIVAVFGPSVCASCYEVDEELATRFTENGWREFVSYPVAGGKPHLDLQGINAGRLLRRGVPSDNIFLNPDCTLHSGSPVAPRYHSWRRTPGTTSRNLTTIMLAGPGR